MGNSTHTFDEMLADAPPEVLVENRTKSSRRLLDESLRDALPRAIEQDRNGSIPPEMAGMIEGEMPTCEELTRGLLEIYDKHGEAIDAVIRSVRDFLSSPGGIARVQAFRAAMESSDSEAVSAELASGILNESGIGLVGDTNRLQGVQGVGIGASLGFNFFYAGLTAGADLVIDTNDSNIEPRTWWAVTMMKSTSINGGLELSIWFDNKPLTGVIMGAVADLYVPMTVNYPLLYVRAMGILQRVDEGAKFIPSAITLQFPFGLMRPVGEKAFTIGGFYGKQSAYQRSKRSTLDVINESTDGKTISVDETTTLKVTFANNSVYDYYLNQGSTLTLNMPSYFTDDDLANMSIELSGWSFSTDSGKLILTASSSYKWDSESSIEFEITNVSSSSQPSNSESTTGQVTASLDSNATTAPITATCEFDLVWMESTAEFFWTTTINTELFTLTGPSWGTIDASAFPGNVVKTLTTATNVQTQDVWVLGYIYTYNTSGTSVVPEVMAVWWQQGQVQINNKTIYESQPLYDDGTAICYYGGLETNGCAISIEVTFDS